MQEEIAANLRLWDGWSDLHMSGTDYDVDGFVANPESRPFDWVTREVVGEVTGKRLLHLQCHIGIDTLRFARAGAIDVTGVDFSPRAIAAAKSIAARLDLPARFVQADVTELPDDVARAAYDVVFTSYGTVMWLPDLDKWAQMIASRLAPGGVFHIIDAHPFLTVFDDVTTESVLRVIYPYFSREPLRFEEHGSYADRDADFVADSYAWQHTFAEIVGCLVKHGLHIEQLREYPVVAWKALEFMVQDEDGLWRVPPGVGDIPLMFSLTAVKPLPSTSSQTR
ncbi:MAG: class I SAM-dependent methyltransferase [Coriobacteriia bacterium]|nr:class I SAM-dependent methyltransferase [Coriobacteriia bacterium]